jgi:hypothetical protein
MAAALISFCLQTLSNDEFSVLNIRSIVARKDKGREEEERGGFGEPT